MDTDGYRLRQMEPYDFHDVIQLEKEILQFPLDKRTREEKEALFRKFLHWAELGDCICSVLESSHNDVLGYFILITNPQLIASFYHEPGMEDMAYLAQIAIHQDYQNHGIGTWLLNRVEQLCVRYGKTRLLLEVNSRAKAYQWYLAKEFKQVAAQVFLQKELSQ
jgi:GNAT superfamily N-acetyltransferase